MTALDWMMKAYPEVKEREDMRRIIGRYGLTGTQQVLASLGRSSYFLLVATDLYSALAPHCEKLASEALRHGSHSFYAATTPHLPLPRKAFTRRRYHR